MPTRLRPPAAVQDLSTQPLHAIVRDYPETLEVLRQLGIDVAGRGTEELGAVNGGAALVEAIASATVWRER